MRYNNIGKGPEVAKSILTYFSPPVWINVLYQEERQRGVLHLKLLETILT